MATIAQFNQDDEQNQQGQNPGGGGQVINSTGGDASSSGGGSASAAPAGGGSYSAPRQQQSGTPNISQYLAANQGAGQQLASGITGNIQNQANQLGKNVNKAQNTLEGQYQGLNQHLGEQGQQNIQTAFQNPQSLLDAYNQSKTQSSNSPLSNDQQNSLNQYNEFQNLNTGGYNQDISKYGTTGNQALNNLQGQYGNLAQQTGSAGNEMGRFQLLRNTVGQPGYNQGQQALDELFLQAQPGVANQLQRNLGQIGSQAQQQVQGFGTDTQSKLAALQGLSGQDQQMIKHLFTGGVNDINQNVQNEYATAKQNAGNTAIGMDEAFKSNRFTPDQLQQLGLTQGMQTWGVNLKDAGQYHVNPLLAAEQGGYAQTATPEEFARYNALNQLAGGPSGLQQNMFGTATSAGGFKPVGYDTNALNSAIKTRKDAILGPDFQSAVQATMSSLGGGVQSGAGFGGIGTGPRYDSGPEANLLNQLQTGLTNKSLTPEQANQYVQQAINSRLGGRQTREQLNQFYNPYLNYYNSEYTPAAASQVGLNTPESTPLPMDWSQITPPTGGAGKGGADTTPNEDWLPPK